MLSCAKLIKIMKSAIPNYHKKTEASNVGFQFMLTLNTSVSIINSDVCLGKHL